MVDSKWVGLFFLSFHLFVTILVAQLPFREVGVSDLAIKEARVKLVHPEGHEATLGIQVQRTLRRVIHGDRK